MRYAVIDCGSNTIRLGVYEYENEELREVYNHAVFANLAGFIKDNRLTEEGILKAIEAVEEHKKTAEEYGAKPYLFATAAIRNADNTEEICQKIEAATEIAVDVLTGDEEAMYSFYGAVADFSCNSGVMADVGGGSSEVVVFENKVPVAMHSVPLGSLKAFRTYVSGDIPTKEEAKAISAAVLVALSQKSEFANLQTENLCIVGGGVSASLALAEAYLHEPTLTVSAIDRIRNAIMEAPDAAVSVLKQAAPKREQTITPALAIYAAVGAYFQAKNVFVSHKGIKEGYILKKLVK